jgi:hypothetical protein
MALDKRISKRKTIAGFSDGLKRMPELLKNEIIKSWNQNTIQTLDDAKQNAPVATGDLEGSGKFLKAVFTPNGIESQIIFSQPYAARINLGKTKSGKKIRLKKPGEVSQRLEGITIKKQRTGKIGFLNKAVEKNGPFFVDDLKDIIGKVWKEI